MLWYRIYSDTNLYGLFISFSAVGTYFKLNTFNTPIIK